IIDDFYFNAGLLKTFDSLSIAKSDSIVMYDKRIGAYEDSIEVLHKLIGALNNVPEKDTATTTGERASFAHIISDLTTQIYKADSAREQVHIRKQKSGW